MGKSSNDEEIIKTKKLAVFMLIDNNKLNFVIKESNWLYMASGIECFS